jgi:hypothetical protein
MVKGKWRATDEADTNIDLVATGYLPWCKESWPVATAPTSYARTKLAHHQTSLIGEPGREGIVSLLVNLPVMSVFMIRFSRT